MSNMEDQAFYPPQVLPQMNTRTTVTLSEACVILFKAFYKHQPQWSKDQLARFNIWTANLGVFKNGHASVDYRLRDHADVLGLVIRQLYVLKINLEKLNSPESEQEPSQIQKRGTSGSESFDIDGEAFFYDSSTSEDSLSCCNSESEKEGHINSRLREDLQTVEDTIVRLNVLSTAIRRSGGRSRASKADLYEVIEYVDGVKINMTNEFEKFASRIVEREIPHAENFLKGRLAVSIARRRNRFLYWQRYNDTSMIYVTKAMPPEQANELEKTQQAKMSQAEDSNIKKQSRSRDERTVMTGFTATTFEAQNFRMPTASSARVSIKSTASVRWKNREEFPKPPKIGMKQSHFVCPICFILNPAKEAKGELWIEHVIRDLQPYICVFEGCKNPQTAFNSFQDWVGHMQEEQMPFEWHCASASHPRMRFKSQALYESHMRAQHPKAFVDAQLPVLAKRSMRFTSDIFTSCPFCSHGSDADDPTQSATTINQDDLQNHIAHHLQSLAIISLPLQDTGDASELASIDSLSAAIDSRVDDSERMEPLQFEDIFNDPESVESGMSNEFSETIGNLTEDFDWDFVPRSILKEDAPDSVLARMWKMQQNRVSNQNVAFHHHVHQQQGAFTKRNLGPPLDDDGITDITRASNRKGVSWDSPIKTDVEGVLTLTPSRESKYAETVRMQQQTLQVRENILDSEHPETLKGVHNLAMALFFQGKYKAAEVLYRQALAVRVKEFGPGHLDTLKSMNNLAQALVYQGKPKSAEKLYRQALAGGEKILGLEHPYVLQNIHNLGRALRKQGQYEEAEKLYRQALAGRERVLRPDHPDTLQSVNNLGGVFERKGQYEAAEKLYRQALTSREKELGLEHPDTLQSVHSVAGALRNQGQYKAAERLYRKALLVRENVLGPEHPSALKSLNNLALVLEKQKEYEVAEKLYRQALTGREKVLGPEHPDTLQSVNNTGSVLFNQGDYETAERLFRRALLGRERVLGPGHPNTLQSVGNLGRALEKITRLKEAEKLYQQALAGREKLLGPGHPDTLRSASNLARLFRKQDNIQAAQALEARLASNVQVDE